ncbi:pilin/secretion family protein with methylation motif [Hoeflea marina]|uniref:Pilin/secretion family protein with methylation motif n=2 Tax=Hoeflea marina TaxID=274592 RepID=A0A317PKN3_9HYPH|nr:pilin/secretion family protein with methylation motif [Hoeflea marina]
MHGAAAGRGEDGFTLLETLIAFTILAGALSVALQGLSIAARQLNAAVAAEALHEFASRAAATAGAAQPRDPAGAFEARTTTESRVVKTGGIHRGLVTLRRVEVFAPADSAPAFSRLAVTAMAIGGN